MVGFIVGTIFGASAGVVVMSLMVAARGGNGEEQKEHQICSPDTNVEKNRQMLLDRSLAGIAKYGVTTSDNPLELREWLQHALEEVLDLANYLQAAITKLDSRGVGHVGEQK